MFDHPHSKGIFPNIESKPPLAQLCAVSSCPIIGHQGEEISISISASPPQEVVERKQITSWPPFLQTRQPKCPQHLLTGHAFQPFDQFCYPFLDALKYINILFLLWSPEHNIQGEDVPWVSNPHPMDTRKSCTCAVASTPVQFVAIITGATEHPRQVLACPKDTDILESAFINICKRGRAGYSGSGKVRDRTGLSRSLQSRATA